MFGDMVLLISFEYGRRAEYCLQKLPVKYVLFDSLSAYESCNPARTRALSSLPQPVCKQYWFETSKIFINTCTFVFQTSLGFSNFARYHEKLAAQVRRVKIFTLLHTDQYLREHVLDAFSMSIVGKLESLEGVDLVLDY